MGTVSEVKKPIAMDNFITRYWKTTFTRLRVEINLLEPLKLGVLIYGEKGIFWQPFVYKNVLTFCYKCCRMNHVVEDCKMAWEEG